MKRRWRILAAVGGLVAAVVLVPIGYIEGGCRPAGDAALAPYTPLLPAAERRPAVQSYLTYPEWHIVYEAEAFARHLTAGKPPSSFAYGSQIGGFWTSYCAVNRLTGNRPGAGAAKVTIYTIGISYTVELAVKAAYERTIGRLFEWGSGWTSADDRYAARVQADYGRFLHETPWYRFPFGRALAGEWRTTEPELHARHWERRLALSGEYGVKAVYAGLIDRATGATVGRDERTLRMVVQATPQAVRAIDPRLVPVRTLPGGRTVVEAPRYQQFNDLLTKLAATDIPIVEIAGNDEIFTTLLLPETSKPAGQVIFTLPIDRPGWRRFGVATKVPHTVDLLRQTRAAGGTVEHVYDY
ncbi:hypothetical protein [Sphingomonas sp.]|uniref:hypothetical protein n=1 Tax=Sphingomonas sp. TaxID=28214 RepID=UPI003B3A7F7C